MTSQHPIFITHYIFPMIHLVGMQSCQMMRGSKFISMPAKTLAKRREEDVYGHKRTLMMIRINMKILLIIGIR